MIAYENVGDAMHWLVRAFRLTEKKRLTDKERRVIHGELELSGSTVMVAAPTPRTIGGQSGMRNRANKRCAG
jgi:uncharacterized glyoxalase superfamily protein PhnB